MVSWYTNQAIFLEHKHLESIQSCVGLSQSACAPHHMHPRTLPSIRVRAIPARIARQYSRRT